MNEKFAHGKKILIAEDDNSIRRLIEVTLKREGAEVLSAEDGLEAMQIISKTKPHLIVADAMMPNMSGFDLCRMVKNNADLREVPFILLSGFEKTESHKDIQPDAFLTKDNRLMRNLVETISKIDF